MKKSSDRTIKNKAYDFSFSHRREGFDNHIGLSIRGYDQLHSDVVSMSRYFVEDKTSVVDIGSSTGKTMAAMAAQNHSFAPEALYLGIEPAEGFANDMASTIFKMREAGHKAEYYKASVVDQYMPNDCSYVTSLFTLQFISKALRRNIIEHIYDQLIPGGAFVFSEKVYSTDAQIQDMLTFLHYDFKRKSFSDEDILNKENELRNMLKPLTWEEIEIHLHDAGFKTVDTFWKSYNFVGAIAIK